MLEVLEFINKYLMDKFGFAFEGKFDLDHARFKCRRLVEHGLAIQVTRELNIDNPSLKITYFIIVACLI